MISGFENIREWLEGVSYVVTSLSLIGILFTYWLSEKQVHFLTMEKCINDFRRIILDPEVTKKEISAIQYIDLVNEELFYIQNGYIPKKVAIEWFDGMLEYLPHFISDKFYPSSSIDGLKDKEATIKLFTGYPRVKRFLFFSDNSMSDELLLRFVGGERKEEVRAKVIYQLFKNLGFKGLKLWRIKLSIPKVLH